MATVTFFFADQAGSTAQLERLGDAGAKGVRQALIDMLRQAAEDHHGEVVDHTGDGLMITFASAVDAVACGVVVQQQAARHNARHPEAEALGVRVGIHTGEPLVNDEGRWFGVPVVVAARLCAAAGTGQVLVSDVTRALVAPRRAHRFTALGERDLKGIAEPVAVAAVDWAPEETEFALPEVLAAAAAGPFVGRAAELEWLEGLWAQAAGAPGTARRRVALLAGDPGIGKTRLAAALAGSVHERGGLVLYGRCDEEPTGPYQPLAEALDAYVAAVPRAELRQQLGPAGGVLTRVLPRLAERVPHLAGPARLEPETEPFLVAEAAEGLLVAVARTTPTLLVLDDLHWADEATLLVVRQLARGPAPAPLLVLGCYREPDVGRSRVLAEAGVDPRRPGPVQHRTLTGLPAGEVAELLTAITGQAPPDELVRTVDAETEGNPFFVHQLAGNLVEKQLAQKVGRAARRARTARLDLRGVREELVAGVLELQRVRDRPGGQGADAEGHAGLLTAEVEPDGTPPVPTPVPYKGLVRFEAGDAGLFFGRERLVAQLVARLVTARFLAVLGASGSGKSSLVRAGLLPTLAAGALPGSDTWVPLVLAPGAEPLAALAERLASLLAGSDPAEVAARLAAGPGSLDQLAAEALAGRPPTARLLLVVDQFEELFTACRDDQARRAFVELLVTAAGARDGRCVVALALRADFYGRCASHPELAAELADSQVLVGPMTDQELRRAVLEPARRVGCVVEGGLPETILEDVAAEPGALPLVSTALLETWERRRGRSLTLTAYAETGGVRGAVARLADGVYDGFDPAEQATARALFLRLTEPGEGADDLRRRARRDELGDDPVTERVLGVLVARRLVTADEHTVEVAHEALLREWPRLRAWLEEDREGRRLHRHLGEATADWEAHDHDPEQLYRGARLAAALDWARAHAPDLNQRERQFLDASRAHHERQLRRARRTTAVLAGLLVLALIAGGLALVQRSTARHQEVLARSTALASQASARREIEPDLALLLAVEGHRLNDSVQTRAGLLDTVGQSPQLEGLHQGYGETSSVDLSPDEATLAVRTVDGRLRLWDFRTRTPRTPPIDTGQDKGDVAFSPDGRLLATGGEDGPIRLWDARDGTPVGAAMHGHGGGTASVEFSPDSRLLVSSGFEDGRVRLWAVPSGKAVATIDVDEIGSQFATFSPDGRTVAAATELTQSVVLIDVAKGRLTGPPLQPPGPDVGLTGVAFSPDGSTIATGTSDGSILLWDAASRKRRGSPLAGHEKFVRAIVYSPDGSMLASGAEDGTGIMLWDTASGLRLGNALLAHPGAESDVVRFIRDGSGLLTDAPTEVAVWDLGGVALGRRITGGHHGRIYDIASSPDGRLLASTGQEDGTVRLWDVATRRPLDPPLKTGASTVTDVAFSPDGRLLAVGTLPNPPPTQLQLWDLASRKRIAAFESDGQVTPRFSADSRTVAGHDGHGRVILWDVAGRRQRGPMLDADVVGGHAHAVMAFSPDNRTLVTGGRLGQIKFWDPATGSKLAEPGPTHADIIVDLEFSPDGALVASASADGNVLFWDPRRRAAAGAPLSGGGGALSRVAFSPDGTVLATTDHTSNVNLWDVASRQQIGRPLAGHTGDAVGVTFVDQGNTLVTSGADGSLIFWDLRPASWEAKACALAGRNLTRDEWDQFVGGGYRRTCPQWPQG